MAWDYFPLTNGDDIQLHEAFIELWVATRERSWAKGQRHWPRTNLVQESGDSFSLSGTHGNVVLSDGDKDWTTAADTAHCSYSDKRWTNYTITCDNTDMSYIVATYDVIFDHLDPRKVVRCTVTDNTINTLTLNLQLDSLIAEGIIDSLSDLESRTYYIIKHDGLWWSDRWPNYANPNVHWLGELEQYVTVIKVGTPFNVPIVGKTFKQTSKPDLTIVDAGVDYLLVTHQSTARTGAFTIYDGATLLYTGTISSSVNGLYEATDKYHGKNLWQSQRPVNWSTDQWASTDLIIADSGGKIHRYNVTHNYYNVIELGSITWTPSGHYAIVATDALHVLNHENAPEAWWYGGLKESFYSHQPDDGDWPNHLAPIQKPVYSKLIADASESEFCDPPQSKNALDLDVWTDFTNVCGGGWSGAEKCYSPDMFKTIRGLQVEILNMCQSFVPVISGGYDDETAIPFYNPARLLYAGNVNKFSSTTAKVAHPNTTDHPDDFAIRLITPSGLPYSPIAAYWSVIYSNGDTYDWSSANLENGVTLYLGGTGTSAAAFSEEAADKLDGLTVQWSYGFTRYYPLEFRGWPNYEKTCFIPDIDSDSGNAIYGPSIIDYCCTRDDEIGDVHECCRDCYGRGQWVKHQTSNTYYLRSGTGFGGDGGGNWTTGDVARFIGDNFSDGLAGDQSWMYGDNATLAPHWDRFFRGKSKPELDNFMSAQRAGEATSGAVNHLTDTDQDWHTSWYGNCLMRTETGTATGGSSTTMIDTTKIFVGTGDGNPLACFWMLDRKISNDGYKDFIIEVDKVTGVFPALVTTTYKAIITSVNTSTGTITFTNPTASFTVVAGDVYRIKEPAELNRFKSRKVEIRYADGSTATKTITHSDNETIWFNSNLSTAVVAGTQYVIDEPIYGGVYKYNGTTWEPAEGTDSRGQDFKGNITMNLPHKRKAYGNLMDGDYFHKELLNELYRIIDVLRWTKEGAGFQTCADGVTPECNKRGDITYAFGYYDSSGPCDTRYPPPPPDCPELCVYELDDATAIVANYFDYVGDTGLCNTFGSNYGHNCETGAAWSKSCTSASPYVLNGMEFDGYKFDGSGPSSGDLWLWSGGIQAQSSYMTWSGLPDIMSFEADLMFFSSVAGESDPKKPSSEVIDDHTEIDSSYGVHTMYIRLKTKYSFNAYGTAAKECKWAKHDTVTTPTGISSQIGNISNAVPENLLGPTPDYSYGGYSTGTPTSAQRMTEALNEGFYVSDKCIVMRWDVSGGMVKIS